MKKSIGVVCSLLLALIPMSFSLAVDTDFTGEWRCLYMDMGDGILRTEDEGLVFQDVIVMQLNGDGSFAISGFGTQGSGTWQPMSDGIAIFADGLTTHFTLENEMLTTTEGDVTLYFSRATGFLPQDEDNTNQFVFSGNWKCIAYEASGVSYDSSTFLPDGMPITLYPDGTGAIQVDAQTIESVTWSIENGYFSINGSYLLYDPLWNAENGQLTFRYISDDIRVVYVKDETPKSITVPYTPLLPQIYTCAFFSVAFPDAWVQDESKTYAGDKLCSAQYSYKDSDGHDLCDVQVIVSIEDVSGYRNGINEIYKEATMIGLGSLAETVISGIAFQGLSYGETSRYSRYLARVPEASVTIEIRISNPENVQDVLPNILDSIRFSYPVPDSPYVDPPMAEHGDRFKPSPTAVTLGAYELKAKWLTTDESIHGKSKSASSIALMNDTVYMLAGDTLHIFTRFDDTLMEAFSPVDLQADYRLLSASQNGTLYISDGYSHTLSYHAGEIKSLDVDGYLVTHPDGLWGLRYWASSTMKKVTIENEELTMNDWALHSPINSSSLLGRFSSVEYMLLTTDHIFVAGPDTSSTHLVRIAMYDLDGNELGVYGSDDWMSPAALGSVTGIVETRDGILVQDGLYREYKLFTADGAYIGAVGCDALLGTNNPLPVAMTATDVGALVLLEQDRADASGNELLLFELTGF
ncbi:MAG TPA: hypothetical protein P5559_02310 [Candidatus Limiplasma sp.]|nr:hypothetical protein [Candidatus Limiplasma sp.]